MNSEQVKTAAVITAIRFLAEQQKIRKKGNGFSLIFFNWPYLEAFLGNEEETYAGEHFLFLPFGQEVYTCVFRREQIASTVQIKVLNNIVGNLCRNVGIHCRNV